MLRFKTEFALLREHWAYFVILLPLIVVMHNAAHNAVFWRWNHYQMYKLKPLPDVLLGRSLLVPLETNSVRMGTMIMTIATFVACLFIKTGHSAVLLVRRFVAVYSVASLMRCVLFFATLLPATASYCLSPQQGGTYTPLRAPHTLHDVFARFDWTHSCGDLLFSGHTALIVGMYLCIEVCLGGAWDRFHASKSLAVDGKWAAAQILGLYGARLKLALFLVYTVRSRKHYTIDVLVALIITVLLWIVFSTFLDTRVHADSDDIPCTCCEKCSRNTISLENGSTVVISLKRDGKRKRIQRHVQKSHQSDIENVA